MERWRTVGRGRSSSRGERGQECEPLGRPTRWEDSSCNDQSSTIRTSLGEEEEEKDDGGSGVRRRRKIMVVVE